MIFYKAWASVELSIADYQCVPWVFFAYDERSTGNPNDVHLWEQYTRSWNVTRLILHWQKKLVVDDIDEFNYRISDIPHLSERESDVSSHCSAERCGGFVFWTTRDFRCMKRMVSEIAAKRAVFKIVRACACSFVRWRSCIWREDRFDLILFKRITVDHVCSQELLEDGWDIFRMVLCSEGFGKIVVKHSWTAAPAAQYLFERFAQATMFVSWSREMSSGKSQMYALLSQLAGQ